MVDKEEQRMKPEVQIKMEGLWGGGGGGGGRIIIYNRINIKSHWGTGGWKGKGSSN